MTTTNPSNPIQTALEHHQAGRLAEAERIYRQILAEHPNYAPALHLLGLLAGQVGHNNDAIDLISRAIAADPTNALYYVNIANFYRTANQIDHAIAAYRKAIEIQPDFAEAYSNLTIALIESRKFDEALAAARKAVALKPDLVPALNNLAHILLATGQYAEAILTSKKSIQLQPTVTACNNLGTALAADGRSSEAIAAYQQALQLQPANPTALTNLGLAQMATGHVDQAIANFQSAIDHDPTFAEAHANLALALGKAGQLDAAIAAARKAAELNPASAASQNILGMALAQKSLFDQALPAYQNAIELDPKNAAAHYNLGTSLRDQGQLKDAAIAIQRAVELEPNNPIFHDCWLFIMQFLPGYDSAAIYREHARWQKQHAIPLEKFIRPHDNDPSPTRRLRIGYVSPHFSAHVVGRNILPLLTNHDRTQFEVQCFANVEHPDAVTARFQQLADKWHDTNPLNDAQLADLIRQEKIDILVDLTLHMARNRTLVFARKPAPIQITFAGYPGTTGLDTIDYRLTDPYLDPPAKSDQYYAEKSVRLPHSFWCYDPPSMTFGLPSVPEPGPLPAYSTGHITFGCLNSFSKINDDVYALWVKVLSAISNSHLTLLVPPGPHRQQILNRFQQQSIDPTRIQFVEFQPFLNYLQLYQSIDIGLDTFPYNGHTTSLDALYMGVPIITLVGQTVVGRAGLSQLTNLGLPEFIAETPEQYVKCATSLANNLSRLRTLRTSLRQKLLQSPLANATQFTKEIESAYRQAWRQWCTK